MTRRVSYKGREFIKHHEELRLEAYDDFRPRRTLKPGDKILGTVTIGWGHTSTAEPGMEITRRQAEALFEEDLAVFERAVEDLTVGVPVSQNQFDALVSFAFNVGAANLAKSTLLKKLRAGAPAQEVAAEFHRWVFSKGVRLEGLVKRRADEANIFLYGTTRP